MDDKKYNIFVSYAWADNKPFDTGTYGWVSTFVDRLRKHLEREIKRQYARDEVWLDYEQLRGSDSLTPAIRAKLESSRILMPIISPSYLDSPWCQQELKIFLEQHGPNAGRIFPVWMEPINDLPSPLDDLLKYKFWYEDERKQPRTRWFPDIDPTDREYGYLQQDMARDLAKKLVKIRQQEPNQPPAQSSPKATLHQPNSDHLVLVNGGDSDATLIWQVAYRLSIEHGISALVPHSALPIKIKAKFNSPDITHDLREKLKLCSAVLMVYQKGPAHQLQLQVTEFLKVKTQRRKDQQEPTLAFCHTAGETPSLGFYSPLNSDFPCGPDCVADCTQQLAAKLS